MFGLDRRYMTPVAFVMGYDEATGRTDLNGFRDWVAKRILGVNRSPIFWASVIGTAHGVHNWKETPPEKDEELRSALVGLLLEFADARE